MLADVFRFMILFILVLLVLQKEIKMLTAFGHKGLDWTNGGNKMCNFRNYPYLPQGRDFFLRPPPPRKFQSLLWGEYGYFLELNNMSLFWHGIGTFLCFSKLSKILTFKVLMISLLTTLSYLIGPLGNGNLLQCATNIMSMCYDWYILVPFVFSLSFKKFCLIYIFFW